MDAVVWLINSSKEFISYEEAFSCFRIINGAVTRINFVEVEQPKETPKPQPVVHFRKPHHRPKPRRKYVEVPHDEQPIVHECHFCGNMNTERQEDYPEDMYVSRWAPPYMPQFPEAEVGELIYEKHN